MNVVPSGAPMSMPGRHETMDVAVGTTGFGVAGYGSLGVTPAMKSSTRYERTTPKSVVVAVVQIRPWRSVITDHVSPRMVVGTGVWYDEIAEACEIGPLVLTIAGSEMS